ncbi:hypothetical protein GA0074696_0178 [Micromonospora purpureochromogenes]|uniref:Thioredoxin domain-containing protein n=1 Tax=Micromonospora purpureochromogenes TaxID=47872 RepID=A0A1C4U811_9ACTN|nr:hypothetical protein [Micromonospora purpureochromogenes]SCE67791.1 hypothetical protein GA0074696_0178 [Micromonospora purpureochromogenes]
MGTTILGAVVAVMSLVLLGNVALTLAVVRRLRELESGRRTEPDSALPATGRRIGPFALPTLDGGQVHDEDFHSGSSLAVFLMPGCGPCAEVLRALHAAPADPGPLIVFVLGDVAETETREVLSDLPERARVVVVGTGDTTVAEAFGVTAYPAVLRIVDGAVAFASNRLAAAEPAGAGGRA